MEDAIDFIRQVRMAQARGRLISSTHPGVAVQGAIYVDEILYKKVHGGPVAEEKVSRCQQIK